MQLKNLSPTCKTPYSDDWRWSIAVNSFRPRPRRSARGLGTSTFLDTKTIRWSSEGEVTGVVVSESKEEKTKSIQTKDDTIVQLQALCPSPWV
ncbi:hypothetical protein PsorP6_015399 [Peronosclerospora sorghi]|uniref:Uncharacterized protein n=1 Tax=Peronosclerospora sorghi TaxID=230839 RepID=A0ACC0WPK3_9STRA|nr:hypothetical protein PsorP6_015399 [Peronosclerospora sorghi]